MHKIKQLLFKKHLKINEYANKLLFAIDKVAYSGDKILMTILRVAKISSLKPEGGDEKCY